jgi:hypothetical protein
MNVDDQRHEPGVCHEPVSWDVLQDIVQDGSVDALGTLGRTVKDLEIYDDFKDKVIRREYASTVDYLMIKVFECESKITSGTLTLLSLIPPVSCAVSDKPHAM